MNGKQDLPRVPITIQHNAWIRLPASIEPNKCDEPLYTVPLNTSSIVCRQAIECRSLQGR